jgi:hypothetical protein
MMIEKYIKVEEVTDRNSIIEMKITHIPTGIYVKGEGKKKFLLKDQLLEELGERLKIPAGTHD